MKDWVKYSNHLGIFLALLFILCFVWTWVHPVQYDLHQRFLELWFYGYTGTNVVSVFLGIVQSFIWGYIGVGLWNFACCLTGCGKCCKKGKR